MNLEFHKTFLRTFFYAFFCAFVISWLAPLDLSAAPSPSGETRTLPARDMDSVEWQSQFRQRLRSRPYDPALAELSVSQAADFDINHIAILEDTGDLTTNFLGVWNTDTVAIVRRFYENHSDDFDYLTIFVASTFVDDIQPEGGFAFQVNIANEVTGIGMPLFNEGEVLVPGLQRLKSLLNMNELGEYNEDPSEGLPVFLNTFSGLSIFAQEVAHIAGAWVNADNVDILGRGGAHWSFFFQTYGSVMEGNRWRDNGNGTFTTIASGEGYSQLDLYLMGFLPAASLTDPMYVIDDPMPDLMQAPLAGDATLPVAGVTVSGTKVDVTLQNITSIYGERDPSSETSQKDFTMGWILVIPEGTQPLASDLEKIDDFRNLWEEEFFAVETNGVARMTSRLGPEFVDAAFEAQQIAGVPGLTVQFDNDSSGSTEGFLWDFGDGSTSTERHPHHTYAEAGSYDVSLTVSGEGGPITVTQTDKIRTGAIITYFHDDFESDQGWQLDPDNTASSGDWLRAPAFGSELAQNFGNDFIAVPVQPPFDHTPNGDLYLVTGIAQPGAPVGFADVDDGFTGIRSPAIDLSAASDPVLSFWSWFTNNAGAAPGKDPFIVDLSADDGNNWVFATAYRSSNHFWRETQIRIADHIPLTDKVRLRFRAGDLFAGSIVEAAVDDIHVFDVDTETAVVVRELSAVEAPGGVLLSWSLSGDDEPIHLVVQRSAAAAGPWHDLTELLAPLAANYLDETAASGQTHWYRLAWQENGESRWSRAVAFTRSGQPGRAQITSVRETEEGIVINYDLARSETKVSLSIYDVSGRRLRSYVWPAQEAGRHSVLWDGNDQRGGRVAKGLYFLAFETPGLRQSQKLVKLR